MADDIVEQNVTQLGKMQVSPLEKGKKTSCSTAQMLYTNKSVPLSATI
jgi:hypothetical protein